MAQKMDIVKITALVCFVLDNDPESRNDDKRLTVKVLQKLKGGTGNEPALELKLSELRKLPAFATITRVRALVQNELGKFLPTKPAVLKARRISEEAWLGYMTGTKSFAEIQGQKNV